MGKRTKSIIVMKTNGLFIDSLCSFNFLKLEVQNENFSQNYTYSKLSIYKKQLFNEFLESEIPIGTQVETLFTDYTSLRSKTRVAEALLFRYGLDNKEKAVVILQ